MYTSYLGFSLIPTSGWQSLQWTGLLDWITELDYNIYADCACAMRVIRIGYVLRAVILYTVVATFIFCAATMSGISSAQILVDSDSSLDSDHELEGDYNTALAAARSLLKAICSEHYR